jgi:Flp pilus assembly protein TadB
MVTRARARRKRRDGHAAAGGKPAATARQMMTRACAVLAGAGVLLLLPAVTVGRASASSPAAGRTVMILLDNDSSGGWLPIARAAALAYVRALPASVRAGLMTVASQWQLVLRPTADHARLERAVLAVPPAGGIYYDSEGLYGALDRVTSAVPTLRQAGCRLLVVSDAENLVGAPLTATIPTDVVTLRVDNDDYVVRLRELASSTGGHLAVPGHAAALAAAAFGTPTATPPPGPRTHRPAARTHRAQAGAHRASASSVPHWPWPLAVGLVALFAALFIAAITAFGSVGRAGRDRDLEERLERYGPGRKPTADSDETTSAAKVQRAAQDMAGRLMSPAAQRKLAERLDLAGIARKPAEWALLGGCLGIVVAAALSLVTNYVLAGVLVGALTGWLAMRLSLSFRIVRRRTAFADQLPDVLHLIASALKSGFSLPQALDAVVREDAQPVAGEFARALAETRLGGVLEDGLEAVANRMDSDDLRWTVTAIRIQQGVGGNLAEVLTTIVSTIRERAFLRRQVRALSAEGRLSAYVIITLPWLIGIWLFISRPQYMRLLYTTHVGEIMLVGAIGLMVVGALWMRRAIKIRI